MSDLPAQSPGAQLQRRRRAELTPAEKVLRRRNRRLMLFIAVPAVVVGVAALLAALLSDQASPSVPPASVPAGYQAVTDGYFGYAVPSRWTTNSLFSDNVGDLETSGASGWVAEHLSTRDTALTAGSPPPSVFRVFGVTSPVPPERAIAISGAADAYLYQFGAKTAIDAWRSSTGTEAWILISASPQVTAEIISTVKA
jgi:hypothetical protein